MRTRLLCATLAFSLFVSVYHFRADKFTIYTGLDDANKIFESSEPVCPYQDCGCLLSTQGAYAQVFVNADPRDCADICGLALCGYSKEVVMNCALTAVGFLDRQRELKSSEHVRRVMERAKAKEEELVLKLQEFADAYKKAKAKAQVT